MQWSDPDTLVRPASAVCGDCRRSSYGKDLLAPVLISEWV